MRGGLIFWLLRFRLPLATVGEVYSFLSKKRNTKLRFQTDDLLVTAHCHVRETTNEKGLPLKEKGEKKEKRSTAFTLHQINNNNKKRRGDMVPVMHLIHNRIGADIHIHAKHKYENKQQRGQFTPPPTLQTHTHTQMHRQSHQRINTTLLNPPTLSKTVLEVATVRKEKMGERNTPCSPPPLLLSFTLTSQTHPSSPARAHAAVQMLCNGALPLPLFCCAREGSLPPHAADTRALGVLSAAHTAAARGSQCFDPPEPRSQCDTGLLLVPLQVAQLWRPPTPWWLLSPP